MKNGIRRHLELLVVLATVFVVTQPRICLASEEAKGFDAHAVTSNYYFKDSDMDFIFGNLVLGSAGNGGVEIGEAYYAASRITDGDASSWQKQWVELARLAEARGEKSLAAGHKVSARDQLLRAANYYRISNIAMLPDNPAFEERILKARALFKKAGQLFSPPVEYVEIPFDGTVLPGYFRKAAPGTKPAKTLLVVGGSETFAEDLFYYIAPQAHARGYNFVTVELPGQGLLPLQGKFFRSDKNQAMKAVVDYVSGRRDVDPARLATFGLSGSVPNMLQTAMFDPRIKAMAINLAVVDAGAIYANMPYTHATPEEAASWTSLHAGVVKGICWRYGVPLDQPAKLIQANEGNTVDTAKIKVPALILVSEGEYKGPEVQRQQKIAFDNLPNPKKKMVVTPANEGASNHCVLENRSLLGQVLFDWLDEVLK
jgi:hypothetical protein